MGTVAWFFIGFAIDVGRIRFAPTSHISQTELLFRETGFIHAAHRAGPVGGEIFKGGAGGDAVVGITDLGIIHVTAQITYVLFHILYNLMVFGC